MNNQNNRSPVLAYCIIAALIGTITQEDINLKMDHPSQNEDLAEVAEEVKIAVTFKVTFGVLLYKKSGWVFWESRVSFLRFKRGSHPHNDYDLLESQHNYRTTDIAYRFPYSPILYPIKSATCSSTLIHAMISPEHRSASSSTPTSLTVSSEKSPRV